MTDKDLTHLTISDLVEEARQDHRAGGDEADHCGQSEWMLSKHTGKVLPCSCGAAETNAAIEELAARAHALVPHLGETQ